MGLIDALREGKEGAATALYRGYEPYVRAIVAKKIPQEDIDEVVQDVFIAAIVDTSWSSVRSIRPWLGGITRHKIADYFRKKKLPTVLLIEECMIDTLSPELLHEKKAMRERYVSALRSLSRRYQRVLRLRYEYGYTVDHIARHMFISHKCAESLLLRARRAFIITYETNEAGIR